MSKRYVRCLVLETPAGEGLRPRGQEWPRDLLPWADPYIATLMDRLEQRYDWTGCDWVDEPDTDDPFAADEAPHGFFPFDDWLWQDADAFMPGWREGPGRPQLPPVYGGFPLLDDVTDGLEEEPI
jgi:hypothetical protein